MSNLLKEIAKEVVVAAKEAPHIYFHPFVLVFKSITGALHHPTSAPKHFKSGRIH